MDTGMDLTAMDLTNGIAYVAPLATLGIAALFVFAGLEVNGRELRRGAAVRVRHAVIRVLLVAGAARAAATPAAAPPRD